MSGLTYRKAGVDIDKGDAFVRAIAPLVRRTFRPEVVADIGSFGALFRLDTGKYKEPVLVSGTDGVGTKLKVAFMTGRHDTVGIDLVGMCVNDIITCGAEPLFFLDYFATGKLSSETAVKVVGGMVRGCEEAGCSLVGGETAEMPGFYPDGEYDISGFAVGVVDRNSIIDGSNIREGDVLVGIASSGLHSNGYSLVRKVFFDQAKMRPDENVPELECSLADELLKPTRIYVKPVRAALEAAEVKGMAHITGGGITGNLPRTLPKGVHAEVKAGSWPVPPIFGLIQKLANVDIDEMRKTFNMGIGYILVVSEDGVKKILETFDQNMYYAYVIGQIKGGGQGAVSYA